MKFPNLKTPKMWKDSIAIAFAILAIIETYLGVSGNSFDTVIPNQKWWVFESLIVDWLVNHNGYEQGSNDDYDKDHAVDATRLFRFLSETQPDELAKTGALSSDLKRRQFLDRLQGEIAKRGVTDVLRKGIKVYPANLIMFYRKRCV